MKILELFCGTKSFSNVAEKRGHICYTIDNDPQFNPNLCEDVLNIDFNIFPEDIDVIWASPPCQRFSVASLSKNWNKDKSPKNMETKKAITLVKKTIEAINILNPKVWFIENPRGMLRTLNLIKIDPTTVTYCQYGDTRMKPTDIWNNCDSWKQIAKKCKNGDKCHISSPRGSRTGTQGLKNSIERGKIPEKLCKEIVICCEKTCIV